ncbi:hypothetical protein [Nakamurella leprariae]|uniref:Uncharacterized protein n=1 Tax=Nakamurella leprariae TaxID=2803911 RepID=A0A938YA38_9ACTN|nr:hypothetical protein [Nakamurella leprariae]MBM9465853.1 hypothetical protein [Nakamurella leprariae]
MTQPVGGRTIRSLALQVVWWGVALVLLVAATVLVWSVWFGLEEQSYAGPPAWQVWGFAGTLPVIAVAASLLRVPALITVPALSFTTAGVTMSVLPPDQTGLSMAGVFFVWLGTLVWTGIVVTPFEVRRLRRARGALETLRDPPWPSSHPS